MRHLVGAPVQLRVADGLALIVKGDGIRQAFRLFLKQIRNAAVGRQRDGRAVPIGGGARGLSTVDPNLNVHLGEMRITARERIRRLHQCPLTGGGQFRHFVLEIGALVEFGP
jgi:hypothetical protein